MSYPATIDAPGGTASQGTSPLTSPDHALDHRTLGSAVIAIETTVGTTLGTNVLKAFAAGDFPVRMNNSSILQHGLQGTFSNSLFSGTLTGQMQNNGTVANGVYGTALHQGGTMANTAIGTPTLLGNGTIAMSGTVSPIQPGAALSPTVGTASDSAGGTITVNSQAAQLWEVNMGTAGGNRTIGTPQNPTDGQFLAYRLKQNTNNTGTVLWASVFRGTAQAAALGTQSTWNYYGWRYNATDTKWDFQGNSIALI